MSESSARPPRRAASGGRAGTAPTLADAHRGALADLVRIFPVADELGGRFMAAGHELHLVGGSVRDALLGRLGDDLDFATSARPDQSLQILRGWASKTWETGREFGTIGAARHGLRLEITTYRAESYDGVSRNPAVVHEATSLDDDLGRRDFTVNAMALSVPAHHFVDPFGGRDDLAARRLRTPAAASRSFADDPLRMLRAARFVAQLGFTADPQVRTAMAAMAGDLSRITAERIRDEFTKLVLSPDPVAGLRLLVQTGLADVFLPELSGLRLEIDEHAQHKDVYEHTLTVLANAIRLEAQPDLSLRLAALLHDVGKPATKAVGADGRVSFHHHELVGARLTRSRLAALRFPKEIISDVAELVALHLRFYGYGRGEWTDSAVRRYVTDAGPLLPRLHVLTRADCTTRNRRRAAEMAAEYDGLQARIAELETREDLARVRPDLDGNAIMGLLNLPPGPLVGQAWRHLKAVRLERGPLEPDQAIAELYAWAAAAGVPIPAGRPGLPVHES